MRRFLLPSIPVLASFIVASGYPLPNSPEEDPCRGGVLYGTVWVRDANTTYGYAGYTMSDGRTAGWGGGQVRIYIVQRNRVLASAWTDATGKYRFCGLPLRSAFDLVAVPADPSGGVHVESVTLTLAGGQQRNVYPHRTLSPMPDAVRGIWGEHAVARRSIAGQDLVAGRSITRQQPVAAAQGGYPHTGIVWADPVASGSGLESPGTVVVSPTTDYAQTRATEYAGGRSAYAGMNPDTPLRTATGDGLTMYFTDGTPRYMQLSVDGLDGRECYFEFDFGLDEQFVQASGRGHDLTSPSWGRIHVERPQPDRLTIDLSGVYTPVCRARASNGGPLTWVATTEGWRQVPPM